MKKRYKINLICFSLVVICMTAVLLFACNSNFSKQCTIEYVAQAGGSITGTLEQSVRHGKDGTQVIAVPDVGYEFVKWSDGSTDAERTDCNITESKTYTAEFKKKTYTITYLAQSGGSLTGTLEQNVKYGENGTQVIAVPDIGYEFVKWSDGNTVAERTEINVAMSKTLTAEFREKICNINYIVQEGGSISGNSAQNVKCGENGTQVIAVPDTGFEFVKWSDGKTEETRIETNVTESKSITAIFQKKTFIVEYKTQDGGSISGNTVQFIKYGGCSKFVTAVPNEGYEFVKWSDGEMYESHVVGCVTDNITITAEFRKLTYKLQYDIEGNGTILGEPYQTVEYGESGTAVTAIPAEHYVFEMWSDGNRDATRTDIDVRYNKLITAVFKKETFTVRKYCVCVEI